MHLIIGTIDGTEWPVTVLRDQKVATCDTGAIRIGTKNKIKDLCTLLEQKTGNSYELRMDNTEGALRSDTLVESLFDASGNALNILALRPRVSIAKHPQHVVDNFGEDSLEEGITAAKKACLEENYYCPNLSCLEGNAVMQGLRKRLCDDLIIVEIQENQDRVALLLAAGADDRYLPPAFDEEDGVDPIYIPTALGQSVVCQHVDNVKQLLVHYKHHSSTPAELIEYVNRPLAGMGDGVSTTRGEWGDTALMVAAKSGNAEIVGLLLQYGADPGYIFFDKKASNYAEDNGHTELAEHLRQIEALHDNSQSRCSGISFGCTPR